MGVSWLLPTLIITNLSTKQVMPKIQDLNRLLEIELILIFDTEFQNLFAIQHAHILLSSLQLKDKYPNFEVGLKCIIMVF